ncbi:hypothetical protein [Mycobacterium sp. ACS1612]|uniref:hypothetical protein n=1 Tax=Mycobacterium sp. ACS1612 TaxID=1834117 RepID=UPI00351196EB
MAWAMLVRLAATLIDHGTPSVLPTWRGNSAINCCCWAGVMAAICAPIRSWLMAGHPATTSGA